MAKLFRKNKRHSFTFLELSISIALVSLVFLPLGLSGKKLLRKWQYERDISKLKAQLQQAYDFVLHCDIPVKVLLKSSKEGLMCALEFENKKFEKKGLTDTLYPHIKKMTLNGERAYSKDIIFSSSGDYPAPLNFTFLGLKNDQTMSIKLKGYPHLLEVLKH